ncbi:hypothetical protein NGRA_1134 [Nosema granulosis]|uniref:Uncharacterized protein n=1 Tax=Nosema granulosis TaxID=83296 RepID=A0A9P6KZN7_9MICR|nr:hypothetical protein NGRA_1134 [Nosema granulosis]
MNLIHFLCNFKDILCTGYDATANLTTSDGPNEPNFQSDLKPRTLAEIHLYYSNLCKKHCTQYIEQLETNQHFLEDEYKNRLLEGNTNLFNEDRFKINHDDGQLSSHMNSSEFSLEHLSEMYRQKCKACANFFYEKFKQELKTINDLYQKAINQYFSENQGRYSNIRYHPFKYPNSKEKENNRGKNVLESHEETI